MSRGMHDDCTPWMLALCGISKSRQARGNIQQRRGVRSQPEGADSRGRRVMVLSNMLGGTESEACLVAVSANCRRTVQEKRSRGSRGIVDRPRPQIKEISPPQLKQAIGQDVLATLAQQTGFRKKSFSPDCRENCQPQSTSTRGTVACLRATV